MTQLELFDGDAAPAASPETAHSGAETASPAAAGAQRHPRRQPSALRLP